MYIKSHKYMPDQAFLCWIFLLAPGRKIQYQCDCFNMPTCMQPKVNVHIVQELSQNALKSYRYVQLLDMLLEQNRFQQWNYPVPYYDERQTAKVPYNDFSEYVQQILPYPQPENTDKIKQVGFSITANVKKKQKNMIQIFPKSRNLFIFLRMFMYICLMC